MSVEPRIQVHPDREALADALALRVAVWIREAVDERGECAVALAGGSTPGDLYRRLARSDLARRVPWEHLRVFFGDERSVAPDHPDSNFRMAREALLDHVPIPPDRIHPMPAQPRRLWAGTGDYIRLLRKHLAADDRGYPRIDLVLLGLGSDGHTASLFPGSCALHAARPVVAVYAPALRAWRMSLTFPTLAAARRVVFMVAGADKAPTVRRVLEGTGEPPLPAQRVAPADGVLEWHLDAAAAADLAGGSRPAPAASPPEG